VRRDDSFRVAQDRRFSDADAAQFHWTTKDQAFAPVEDALLEPWLPGLPFPCLEIACGEGTNLARLARRGRPVGIDRYPEKVRFAAQAVPAARVAAADAVTLPFRDGSFASVLIRDLLHHLLKPEEAVREAVRVLRTGGTLLVIEPNGRNPFVALQARLVPSESRLRSFTPGSVRKTLEGLPLTDITTDMAQGFPLRRLVLHYRFGMPALGRIGPVGAALSVLERLGQRVVPRTRWAYAIIKACRA
jgi:SAM-dependent methyltransferase